MGKYVYMRIFPQLRNNWVIDQKKERQTLNFNVRKMPASA